MGGCSSSINPNKKQSLMPLRKTNYNIEVNFNGTMNGNSRRDINNNGDGYLSVNNGCERRRLSVSRSDPVNDIDNTEVPRGRALFKKVSKEKSTTFDRAVIVNNNLDKDNSDNLSTFSNVNDDFTINDTLENCLLDSSNYPKRRLSVTGALSHRNQETFECKAEEINGDEVANKELQHGIGYVCRKGLKPESPNQDDFFIYRTELWGLYGVFDGHGPFGHDVSNFIQRELPQLILRDRRWKVNPGEVLHYAFIKSHQKLQDYVLQTNEFDCSLSGTTATVILHQPLEQRIITAHVGDSRSVLARWSRSGRTLEAIDLTNDHKPNSEQEKRRIVAAGGQVKRIEGDIPYRVFIKGKMYPGLAMSRAIGDTLGYQAGIIPEPDVNVYQIRPDKDAFILICSDGVWEFISSQEAVDLVAEGGSAGAQISAERLAREAWRRWIQEEGNVVDDITVQVIYLQA
ncbi:protein phosphatase 2C [Cryptosporidium andersoni]|uniref:Protein phosphatase 2C n=1 Tax=Cryptosporidium andersoni TaxID=117008 RepID=A0A1J4MVN7_9CRYT|nr:protein phosphatase 2C [Cryptosporidium andersoni]